MTFDNKEIKQEIKSDIQKTTSLKNLHSIQINEGANKNLKVNFTTKANVFFNYDGCMILGYPSSIDFNWNVNGKYAGILQAKCKYNGIKDPHVITYLKSVFNVGELNKVLEQKTLENWDILGSSSLI